MADGAGGSRSSGTGGRFGEAVFALQWRGLARVMAHETGVRPPNDRVERLLSEGERAFTGGDRALAHELWREAAAADPYDERIWLRLLRVLDSDEDRRVCLENIIGLNPLNTEARQQLRALNQTAHAALMPPPPRPAPAARPKRGGPARTAPAARIRTPDDAPAAPPKRLSFGRAFAIGLVVGLAAILLGVGLSITAFVLGLFGA